MIVSFIYYNNAWPKIIESDLKMVNKNEEKKKLMTPWQLVGYLTNKHIIYN